jgi:quinol-cytochrome oxidoreductase complex cytochrome b subunit
MSAKDHIIPVWFFVGVLFLVYGVLILGSGLAEWSHPPDTVLAELHAPVWWGGVLLLTGLLYCIFYAPWRNRA